MVVVEMKDNGVKRQALVAADRAAPPDILQAIERTMEARADGVRLDWIARQGVSALVRGAERA